MERGQPVKARVISEGGREPPGHGVWESGALGVGAGLPLQLPGKQKAVLPFSVWHFKGLFNVLGQKIPFPGSAFEDVTEYP